MSDLPSILPSTQVPSIRPVRPARESGRDPKPTRRKKPRQERAEPTEDEDVDPAEDDPKGGSINIRA